MNSRKIIRKIRLVSGIIVLLFSSYSYAESSGRITVGSFNIQIFSVQKVKRRETLYVLAETAARFDILAIQEVGSNDSKVPENECSLVMKTYTAEINAVEGIDVYNFVHGNQYGIIYRTDKVTLRRDGKDTGNGSCAHRPLPGMVFIL